MAEEQFGRYRLEELLGRGGMGEVYRAYDEDRHRTVALKRLPPALSVDDEFQARFRYESELTARLRDPHIIPIHDFGEIDGRLFIDMRLVDGKDLDEVIRAGGPLEPERAVRIIAQVASALDAAHADGLVHRDVKPSNILLAEDDFVYLVDFGVARAVAGAAPLTATGDTVGTMDYMAPERFAGRAGDSRADVYSLTCVLYQALTGRKPYPVTGHPAMIHAHLNLEPPAPSEHVTVPARLDEVIAKGMAKDPDDRYQRAGELAEAAEEAVASSEAVIADLTQAIEAEPTVPLLIQRAGEYGRLGRHADALADYKRAMDLDPSALNDAVKAEVAADPDSPTAALALALTRAARLEFDEAGQLLGQALSHVPKPGEVVEAARELSKLGPAAGLSKLFDRLQPRKGGSDSQSDSH